MVSRKKSKKPVGVIGAGSFGTAVANILSENTDVILYARKPSVVEMMISSQKSNGQDLRKNILPTNNLELVASTCDVIFPVVPSANFRKMMRKLSPYLHPYHT